MLNSKQLIERAGISRATLNNYIALGILPRPVVQRSGPEDGRAPRIGYFPKQALDLIAEVQRLKQEGLSMARIAARFRGDHGEHATTAPAQPQVPAAAPIASAPLAAAAEEFWLRASDDLFQAGFHPARADQYRPSGVRGGSSREPAALKGA